MAYGSDDITDAVLADHRTANIPDGLRAMLTYLEKLTLEPESLTKADADAVRAAGFSDAAIEQAVWVAIAFNTIDRVADALGFDVPPKDAFRAGTKRLLTHGYV